MSNQDAPPPYEPEQPYGQQQPPSYGQQPSYGTPPQGPPSPYGQEPLPYAPPEKKQSNVLSIIAMVCGVIAILVLPIVLGPVAIICAGVALGRKEPLGKIGMIVAIAGMVVGFILGAVVATQIN